jgi:nitrous oxidase accessory protein NosD
MKRLIGMLVVTLAVLGIGAQVASAAAVTRFVAPTGSDAANECAEATAPCATIQHAIDEAEAGDTVVVEPGSYAEELTVEKALTLQGPEALPDEPAATIEGGNGTAVSIESAGVSVIGFEIAAEAGGLAIGASEAMPIKGLVVAGNRLLAPSLLRGQIEEGKVQGNSFEATEGNQLAIEASESQVSQNTFEGHGGVACLRILGEGAHPSEGLAVSSNDFDECNPYGIDFEPEVDAITIVGNEFPGSYDGVLADDGLGWEVTGHAEVAENRFVGTAHQGVDNAALGTLEAERNWWGCNAGPGAAGCDAVSEGVDATDNVTLGALIGPDEGETGKLPSGNTVSLNPGERAGVVAVLSASGHGLAKEVPTEGDEIHFSAQLGSMAAPNGVFTEGAGRNVFTAGSAPGQGSIAIGYDNQQITVPVTIRGEAGGPGPAPAEKPHPPRIIIANNKILLSGSRTTVGLVSCVAACRVKAGRALIAVGGHRYRGKVTPAGKLKAESTKPIRVALPAAAVRALKSHGSGRVKVTVSVRDAVGQTAKRTISVKLRT